ncbi:F-box/kelch-repeat protein At3g06240-like [Solanum verrucosum]|uniref:F-box/kelch-repeat protein At3g06240-like n=1 Tax=Solanum verrucosum TaxID=315347 RepID=UPI0020D14D2E|nr:F-box/kelch-repeat protein At3g06240-like [Solanum verrucosum]
MDVYSEENILVGILSRLPVRSLLRFKCVSKFWGTLIDEPYFKMKNLTHAKKDKTFQKFLFYKLRPKKSIFSIYSCSVSSVQLVEDIRELNCPLNIEPRHCIVYCCCDGLVIIKVYENSVERQILLLWNPSTGESIVLPNPEFPMEEFSCLGMCFDSTSNDYKILKIPNGVSDHNRVPGEVLALKSGSWRKIVEHPRDICCMVHGMHSLAFIHGSFHWVGNSKRYFVVSFDISHEVYGEISLPEQISLISINIGISILDGMLCAYTNAYIQGNRTFTLWVMNDYGLKESWHRIFSIADPDICIAAPKYRFADGEVLFWCLHCESGENAYRTERGPFTLLPHGILQNGFAFTESLVSPRLLT